MADPIFDQISASTIQDLARDVAQDNFFVETSWQRIMRYYGNEEPFLGGTFMEEPFQFDRVNGGAYNPGSDVTVVEKTILAAMAFTPRAYKCDLAFNEFTMKVINAGPAAKINLYDAYYKNAVTAMSTDMNIDWYQHGQANSGTAVLQNRTIFMNGYDEACGDGINPGWMGNVYPNYGGQTRTGAVGNVLNAVPIWAGDASGNPGLANWTTVVAAYQNCVQPPDTLLSNKALWVYLWSREEAKQRFAQEDDPRIGLSAMHVFNAHYHIDKLCPSTKFGTLLPSSLSQTTSVTPANFTTPTFSAGQNSVSNYPSATSCKPGEPLFLPRLQDWKIRVAAAPEFNHNFTPEVRSQTNPDLVTQFLKAALTTYTPSPRDNSQIVGFGF